MKILFVCTANICRSFMAEKIMNGMLAKAGRSDIEVKSASLLDMKGAQADPVSMELLKSKGFSVGPHRSTLLNADLVEEADLIIVMEKTHQEGISAQFPQAASKIRLLKTFCEKFRTDSPEIRDCFRKSSYHYRLCFSEIFLSISEGLIKCI